MDSDLCPSVDIFSSSLTSGSISSFKVISLQLKCYSSYTATGRGGGGGDILRNLGTLVPEEACYSSSKPNKLPFPIHPVCLSLLMISGLGASSPLQSYLLAYLLTYQWRGVAITTKKEFRFIRRLGFADSAYRSVQVVSFEVAVWAIFFFLFSEKRTCSFLNA